MKGGPEPARAPNVIPNVIRRPEFLRDAQSSNDQLIDELPVIAWRAHAEPFAYTYVSQYAETLTGYPLAHWTESASFWSEHVHPADRDDVMAGRREAIQQQKDWDIEYRLISRAGPVLWVRELGRVGTRNNRQELTGVIADLSKKRAGSGAEPIGGADAGSPN